MLGYTTIYDKSMNGNKTISDGITTIENGNIICASMTCENMVHEEMVSNIIECNELIVNGNISAPVIDQIKNDISQNTYDISENIYEIDIVNNTLAQFNLNLIDDALTISELVEDISKNTYDISQNKYDISQNNINTLTTIDDLQNQVTYNFNNKYENITIGTVSNTAFGTPATVTVDV
jgi:hypothetical protein